MSALIARSRQHSELACVGIPKPSPRSAALALALPEIGSLEHGRPPASHGTRDPGGGAPERLGARDVRDNRRVLQVRQRRGKGPEYAFNVALPAEQSAHKHLDASRFAVRRHVRARRRVAPIRAQNRAALPGSPPDIPSTSA